ncbi:MAG: S8 family peptidase [Lachnospiraceae bacterium]
MKNQKVENLLNLALDATNEEREKSQELEIGYDPYDQTWDLIIKYSGSLDIIKDIALSVVELQNQFAIITVLESKIPLLSQISQVEYIEKPKRLFFQVSNGRRVSCITSVQTTRFSLHGNGVLVGIIDSGIAYENLDFRNPDGSTRIRVLWDQTVMGNPPQGYTLGTEYTREEINVALSQSTRAERLRIVPSQDVSGHGTSVAGIAVGNGTGSDGLYAGVASQSEMVIVKLGSTRSGGFPKTTELIQAIDYVIRKSVELRQPIAINISFGNTYGSHDGTSLLERFIDDMADIGKNVICIGTGNEGVTAGHTSGILRNDEEVNIELAIQKNQTALNVQIWKYYVDDIEISLITPSGIVVGPIQPILGPQRFFIGQTELLIYYGEPSPYSIQQEIYIEFLPKSTYVDSGVWQIVLFPRKIKVGNYELWLPSENVLNPGTGFLFPTENKTLTIPSTASRAIAVGAYDAQTLTYADFSGRGYLKGSGISKPDLVAPGVNVITTTNRKTYEMVSGTSFAVPFVAGGAALLMEWGIINGNDSYLYGEKVKAYLHRGTKPLPGFTEYPNPIVGYGALCIKDSLPI